MKDKIFTKDNVRVFSVTGVYERDSKSKTMTYARICQINFMYHILQIKAHLLERFNEKTNEKTFFIEMPGIFFENQKTGMKGISFLNFWASKEINKEFQEFILNELRINFPDAFDKIKMKKLSKKSKIKESKMNKTN